MPETDNFLAVPGTNQLLVQDHAIHCKAEWLQPGCKKESPIVAAGGPAAIPTMWQGTARRLNLTQTVEVSEEKGALTGTQGGSLGHTQPPPPPITDLDGASRYIVDSIINHRTYRRQLRYLVKWRGYEEATWEPVGNLQDESGRKIIPLQQYLKSLE
eukprot:scpid90998/ scgid35595/ 